MAQIVIGFIMDWPWLPGYMVSLTNYACGLKQFQWVVSLVLWPTRFQSYRTPNTPIEFAPYFRVAGLLSHSRILALWPSRRRQIIPFRTQDIWSCMLLFAEWAICQVLLNIWICTTMSKTREISWPMMDLQLSIWPRGCTLSLLHRLWIKNWFSCKLRKQQIMAEWNGLLQTPAIMSHLYCN